jgi:23S rRNA pseudouridine1911/1915/1917 synthase
MTDEFDDADDLLVEVPALLDSVRVDRAISMLTGLSRSESHALVERGQVRLDDVVVTRSSTQLAAGQRLAAELRTAVPAALAGEPDVVVDVVVEDPDFVVVDKAPGLVVHPGAGHAGGTLVAGLLARYPELAELAALPDQDPMRPGIVQRLDRGTSGLLVVARTELALRSLSSQLAARSVERRYVGMVEGELDGEGVVDAPLGRSLRTPTKMAVRPGGRPARTGYRVTSHLVEPPRTLLDLALETGRTHQIRVHLAAIGRPIVNDPRYGRRREPALDEGRLFLHAAVLGFEHPRSGATVRTESALPGDLAELLAASLSA